MTSQTFLSMAQKSSLLHSQSILNSPLLNPTLFINLNISVKIKWTYFQIQPNMNGPQMVNKKIIKKKEIKGNKIIKNILNSKKKINNF
jgi:hypothetical protein